MRRSWAIAACGGAIIFATTDLGFYALALWLAERDFNVASAAVNELLLRFVPFVLAGLTAGYVALPRGFSAAAIAGFAGAAFSLAYRYYDSFGWMTENLINATAVLGWVVGIAFASGICGWAGERVRTKGARSAQFNRQAS